ncbi:DUF6029 family protein [Prevotella sp. HUN102]|uniref:DUF6029 family protein n=1 Tax=Prevotella sp. HUN102 TaxID=1392486 RepID=UPI00048CB12C|nr:DUF6029 family protein [Prevotella sp. HUN102]
MKKYSWLVGLLAVVATSAKAQEQTTTDDNKVTVTGSIQSDVLVPQEDKKIGSPDYDEWALTNSFLDLNLISKNVDAGARFEFLKHPLPGFENDYKGYGVPYFYLKGKFEKLEVTLGNYYEQFGSGFVLRTYEERSLGIDNSLFGARVVYKPYKGIVLKAVTGEQRRYWAHNNSWINGADLELNLDEWIKGLQKSDTRVMVGGSFVNKYESNHHDNIMIDRTNMLNLPQNVNAWDARLQVQKGGFNVLAEYAQKTQDPSFTNGYIYRTGNVAMLSASYSKKGLSFLVQAKRSNDMAFKSDRNSVGVSSYINHLPAFTQDQTYALAAFYPYATRPDGEWAYQAQFGYKVKRNTFLGGKYGMNVKVNFSHVHAIDKSENITGSLNGITPKGTKGYGSAFFKWGDETYYQDLNIQIERKFSKSFKLNFMYMNQFYNKTVVEGEGGMVHSDIFIADGKYTFSPKVNLRGEVQYLATKDDLGDWWFGLLELAIVPNWMFTISDTYNAGETNLHYYQGVVTFNAGAHRLQLGYGRTRAGFNCSGGVCRYVPATKGFTLSYNYNF